MFKKKELATDPTNECLPCEETVCKPIVHTEAVYDGSLAVRVTKVEEDLEVLDDKVDKLTFLDLTDTPNTYTGQAGKTVKVKADETGVYFITEIGGGGTPILIWNIGDAQANLYKNGTFVSHDSKIWLSLIDDNQTEPSLGGVSWEAQSVENITGGNLTENVTSSLAFGGTTAGTLFPIGLSFTDYVKLKETVNNITYTNPTYSLTTNAGSLREVGSKFNLVKTYNFDRGTITLNGVFQNFRAGVATAYDIDGDVSTSNTRTVNNYTVVLGNNTSNGTVTHLEGAQPLDVYGNPVGSKYPASTVPQSSTFTGAYYNFYKVGSIATNSAQVRALTPTFSNTFSLVIAAGQTEVSFAYPATKGDIVNGSIKYVEGFNSDVGDTFTKSTFNVNDAGGNPVAYKIYTVTLGAPYGATATYNVTLPA